MGSRVGRPERPLDPNAGPVQRFGYELRKLRHEAGEPAYRAMAQRVRYSATGLSRAAAGDRLPSRELALAYVAACGGDLEEWARHWQEAADEVAALPPDTGGEADAPYLGLARYEASDRERFFGRDRLADELLDLVSTHRFTAVFGASGSGKSSLLRAGLIPRLGGRAPAAIRIFTPGPHPFHTHEAMLTAAAGRGETWLLVDQFEEVWTLCRQAAERRRFLNALLAARVPESRLRVLIAVRADFYARCAEHSALTEALRDAQLLIGPMTAAQLRDVIVRPATAAGLTVERALTARLVAEAEHEPGGLPLLSHALLETWRRRRGKILTLRAYQAAGGLHGALAHTAEDAYEDLSAEQRPIARRILLRLITPGEGAEDTRRPANRAELNAATDSETATDSDAAMNRDAATDSETAGVLEHLVRTRLVIVDGDTVELAHEALISGWPRLRGWIDEDREHLFVHRHLTGAAEEWEKLNRDSGALYRGTRLQVAEEQFVTAGREDELTRREAAFLAAGLAVRDEERRAAARRERRLRRLTAGLAALLVVAATVGVIAIEQRQTAIRAREAAASRQLAAQALRLADSRPGPAMLLAVEAYRVAHTPEARSALLSMSAHQYYQADLTGHPDAVSDVAFAPNGTLASVSRDRTLRLWDPVHRTRSATLTGHDTWLRTVAFDVDGRTLATGGDDGNVVLWDVAAREPRVTLAGHTGPVSAIAFSPGRSLAASAGKDRTVRLWDLARGSARRTLRLSDGANAVAFSPDGRTVAAVGEDGAVRLWSAGSGRKLAELRGHRRPVHGLAFDPDGRTLATVGDDHTVRLWDVRKPGRVAVLTGHTGTAKAVAFSPDGRTVATAAYDNTIMLWDAQRHIRTATLTGHTSNPYALAFHPGGRLLASAGEDGKIMLWDTARIALAGHTERVNDVAFSPDGRTVATASDDRTVVLWDARRRTRTAVLGGRDGPVNALAYSPDGRTLAGGTGDPQQPDTGNYTLTLWGITTSGSARSRLTGHTERVKDVAYSPDGLTIATAGPERMLRMWDAGRRTLAATVDTAYERGANSVAFSPGGRLFATSHHNQTAVLWDAVTRTPTATLRGHQGPLTQVAFSPDGRTLATAGLDERLILWDVATGRRLAVLAGNTGPAQAVAFSPDGHTLASANADNSVVLWDLHQRTPLATLTGHTRQVRAVAFSPDGRALATASDDHTVMLWHTSPERMADQLCATLARDLTPEEWASLAPGRSYHRTCGGRS